MRKTISVFLCLSPFLLFGQQKQDSKFGMTVSLNTVNNLHYGATNVNNLYGNESNKVYSLGIAANYIPTSSNFGARLKFCITKVDVIDTTSTYLSVPDPYGLQSGFNSSNYADLDFSASAGIFYRYKNKKIEVLGGMDLEYISHGSFKIADSSTETFVPPYSDENNKSSTTYIFPKGYSYGVGGFVGFNFYPIKFISIGFELSSALLFNKYEGKYSYDFRTYGDPNQVHYPVYQSSQYKFSNFVFNPIAAAINLSFWIPPIHKHK